MDFMSVSCGEASCDLCAVGDPPHTTAWNCGLASQPPATGSVRHGQAQVGHRSVRCLGQNRTCGRCVRVRGQGAAELRIAEAAGRTAARPGREPESPGPTFKNPGGAIKNPGRSDEDSRRYAKHTPEG